MMHFLIVIFSVLALTIAPIARAEETKPDPASGKPARGPSSPPPATTGTAFGPQGFGAGDAKPRFSAGVAIIDSARPYAGAENRIMVVPALGVEWGDFYLRGIYAGWRFAKSKGFSADVQARWRFNGLEPDDSPALSGMEERKGSLDLGLDLSWRSRWVGVKVLPSTDVLGRSGGHEVAAEVFTMFPVGPVRVSPFAGGSWLSDQLVDYYYGVRPDEATATRAAYEGQATWNWNAGVGVSANVGRVFLQGVFRYQRLGGGITDSPIVDREGSFGAFLIATYGF